MIPYFVFFLASIVFCLIGEQSYRNSIRVDEVSIDGRTRKKRKRRLLLCRTYKCNGLHVYSVYFAISVLIVSVLAGVRGYSVGTDIKVYGNSLFAYAQKVSLIDFIEKLPNIEPLYLTLVDFSTFFSEEAHMLYFFTGLIIYSFIMAGIVAHGKTMPITLSWTGFLLLLYSDTFNAMRQCLGLSIAFFGFHFLDEKQYLKLAVSLIIAFFFHNSVIIMIAIIGIYILLQLNNRIWIKALMFAGTLATVYFFNEMLNTLVEIGLFNSKMTRYQISESNGISVLAILIRLPFLLAILLQRDKFTHESNSRTKLFSLQNTAESDFYIILLLLEMFTVELSAYVASLYRISLYFVPFRCLSYARIVAVQKKENREAYASALVIYLLVIFVYQNMIKGNNEIYPYVFCFAGD